MCQFTLAMASSSRLTSSVHTPNDILFDLAKRDVEWAGSFDEIIL
jgi:hypothetical protein